MKLFDSLVHVSRDGRWLGADRYDASLERLLREMTAADPCRACLVAIADYQDNDTVEQCARAHPERFVPIAGLNPSSFAGVESVEDGVATLSKRGFAGIKLHPRLNRYDPLDERSLAAIRAAGKHDLVVFLDTLFRQPNTVTRHPSDVIDRIAQECSGSRILLLHGGGAHLLEMFELVRMHAHLLLDLSFTLLRYRGSSLDLDMQFLCRTLDQRLTVGSDFPEYTLSEARSRIEELTADLPIVKRENILFRNLENLFSGWSGFSIS